MRSPNLGLMESELQEICKLARITCVCCVCVRKRGVEGD